MEPPPERHPPIARRHFRPHQQRTQCRTQSHGIDQRDSHGHSHRQTELLVERTRRASHETHRDEHGHKHDRSGDQRSRQATHSLDRCVVGIPLSFFKLCLHSLHHYNRIVDNRSDHEHYSKQRQHIERETHGIDKSKRTDERHDDRKRRDQRSPKIMNKQIDHQHHQNQGYDKRLYNLVDRRIKKIFRARYIRKNHSFG